MTNEPPENRLIFLQTCLRPIKWMGKTWAVKWIGMVLSSAIVAGVAGGFVSTYLTERSTIRIESSKLQYEHRSKIIEAFDAANNELLSKIAVFNMDVLNGKQVDAQRQAEIIQMLIKAQTATNELEEITPAADISLIEGYKKELAALGKATQAADQPMALRPVFEAVAQLLPLHDQLSTDARASLKVRGAFGG